MCSRPLSSWRWKRFERTHVALNLGGDLVFGNFQVVPRLQIHPERRTIFEITREAQRRVGSDAAALVDDIADPRPRDAQIHPHWVHAHPQRSHEFPPNGLSRT